MLNINGDLINTCADHANTKLPALITFSNELQSHMNVVAMCVPMLNCH